jgi:flavin reductase (DIM6/NTAB) family NADH-FMN oxidoreductase RutF
MITFNRSLFPQVQIDWDEAWIFGGCLVSTIDMSGRKIKCGSTAILPAVPVVLIGANVDNKPNYNVIGNFGVLRISSPPAIIISVAKEHYTTQGIKTNHSFSVNFPSADLVQKTDYCGIVSGHTEDKSTVFQTFYGALGSAPMIVECPINLECQVIRHLSDIFPDGDIFFAEIVEAYLGNQYLTDNKTNPCQADLKKVNPLVLGSSDYWVLGTPIAKVFSVGKEFRK